MELKSSFKSFEGLSGTAVLCFAMAAVWKIIGQSQGVEVPVEKLLEHAKTVDDILAITRAVNESREIPWEKIGEVLAVLAPALGIQGYIASLRTGLKKVAAGMGASNVPNP